MIDAILAFLGLRQSPTLTPEEDRAAREAEAAYLAAWVHQRGRERLEDEIVAEARKLFVAKHASRLACEWDCYTHNTGDGFENATEAYFNTYLPRAQVTK